MKKPLPLSILINSSPTCVGLPRASNYEGDTEIEHQHLLQKMKAQCQPKVNRNRRRKTHCQPQELIDRWKEDTNI